MTQLVTLDVVFNKEGENPWEKSHVVGFSAQTKVKRSDFGMKFLPAFSGQIRCRRPNFVALNSSC
ncbi:hypothetical protein AB395_00005060 (plasmid) [Sinorhizobium fredii CCBAU 45436]|nr:hypothetical protein AB395_00005060 [Sinorhizobium fredii CCBAU 45436]